MTGVIREIAKEKEEKGGVAVRKIVRNFKRLKTQQPPGGGEEKKRFVTFKRKVKGR